LVKYYLKTGRGTPAEEIDEATGAAILSKGRHEGRRVVEVFTLHPSGRIDRCVERPRRKLGSNAIVSRSWLCETYMPDDPEGWGDDRYIHDAEEAVTDADPAPEAVMLVLLGAEGDSDANVAQLQSVKAHS
jgi:hypothetical protein